MIQGVWVAFPNLDEISADRHILRQTFENLFAQGVQGTLVLGTTGQGADKTVIQRQRELELLAEVCPAEKMILGVAANASGDVRELIAHAERLGVRGVAVTTPFYSHYSEEELGGWLTNALSGSPRAVEYYMYNIPSAMHHRWRVELLAEARKLVQIAGIKDSSGDISQLLNYLAFAEEHRCSVMIGDERFGMYSLALGGAGFVSGFAAAYPGLMCQLYEACRAGRHDEAVLLQKQVNRLVNHLLTNSPRGLIKTLVAWMRDNGVVPQ